MTVSCALATWSSTSLPTRNELGDIAHRAAERVAQRVSGGQSGWPINDLGRASRGDHVRRVGDVAHDESIVSQTGRGLAGQFPTPRSVEDVDRHRAGGQQGDGRRGRCRGRRTRSGGRRVMRRCQCGGGWRLGRRASRVNGDRYSYCRHDHDHDDTSRDPPATTNARCEGILVRHDPALTKKFPRHLFGRLRTSISDSSVFSRGRCAMRLVIARPLRGFHPMIMARGPRALVPALFCAPAGRVRAFARFWAALHATGKVGKCRAPARVSPTSSALTEDVKIRKPPG